MVVPFDKILEAVQSGAADAGLIIHEAQLTYNKAGFTACSIWADGGRTTYELPLPLGGNVLLRTLVRTMSRANAAA